MACQTAKRKHQSLVRSPSRRQVRLYLAMLAGGMETGSTMRKESRATSTATDGNPLTTADRQSALQFAQDDAKQGGQRVDKRTTRENGK
jgi:hypothetical protein